MNTFEASNGMKVPVDGHPFALINVNGVTTQTFSTEDAQALREFFQHERDEELGRWRWPENPDYVVYVKCESESEPRAGVRVLHERTGRSRDIGRAVVNACEATVSRFGRATRAYFEAHPERKPWHDAKPGEAWLIDVPAGPVVAVRRLDGRFYDYEGNLLAMQRVSGARRMYPEAGER